MARKSNTNSRVPSRKNKNSWSESGRTNKTWLVIEGLSKRINTLSRIRKELLRDLQSDGKKSKHRENINDAISDKIFEKKQMNPDFEVGTKGWEI